MSASRAMLFVAVTAMTLAGCGKKGPPLAPLLQAPGRAMDVQARRVGETVYIRFTIPDANLDGTTPADLERVDVYGYTALATDEVRNLRDMTLVASVPVKKPPEPDKESEKATKERPSPPPEPGEAQGTLVTITELLTPASRQRIQLKTKVVPVPVPAPTRWFDQAVSQPLAMRPPEPQPARFYVIYGVSHRGQRGGASPRPSITFDPLPGVPETPIVEVGESAVTVKWKMPATAQRPYQDVVVATPAVAASPSVQVPAVTAPIRSTLPAGVAPPVQVPAVAAPRLSTLPAGVAPPVQVPAVAAPLPSTQPAGVAPPVQVPAVAAPLPSTPKGLPAAPPLLYNVYLVDPGASTGPLPPAEPVVPGARPVDMPLNEKPLEGLSFADVTFEFGKPRCYRVTAVRPLGPPPAAGGQPIAMAEGAPSTVVCGTPTDTFPPPAPSALSAVASEGAVSLIWEGVLATDLAGYVVMRGEARAGPAGMTPLFGVPIRETTYRDASARPGVRYLYAVVAVDNAITPNRSLMSNVVEEEAR